MKKILYFLLTLMIISAYSCTEAPPEPTIFETIKVNIPQTRKDSTVVTDYHGTSVADPYRWLEDDHADETIEWVKSQNEVTFDYLDKIPYREQIADKLKSLWDYEKYGTPFKEGDYYYYFKNDGLQNQSVLYRINSLDGDAEMVLDPNTFSDDGTAALGSIGFDNSGKYLAYQVSEGGSDWRTAKILNLETKELLADEVNWIKFSGLSWAKDGFYYSRYPEPAQDEELSAANEYHKLYYHKLGDDQSDDVLVYEDKAHANRNVYGYTTDDERYLVLGMSESTSGNALKVKDSTKPGTDFVNIWDQFDSDFRVIDNIADQLLVVTNHNAPNQKLIGIDPANPAPSAWKEIIPESNDALRGVSLVGSKIFAYYLHDASSKVKVHEMDGTFIQDLELPGIGSIGGISGDKNEDTAFYSFTSFTRPNTIYKLDINTLKSEVFRKPAIEFDSDAYVTKQLWYTSKDGTKVPMFVTHQKGLQLDGTNPTLLYGYGGFNIPITPSFSVSRLPLIQNGGVYAVANIRGGGEFGKAWHKAGTLDQKQNVFDDFIGAAEYLISENYTSSDKLAIQGGSNGGLLVGACMTQRPDLFAVAFPAVGVLDMLRYHEFTIGWAWASDYGRSDDPEAFKYLMEYSPLHNVRETAYPATMVTTADHDDRVVPAHSFKFISEIQDKHKGDQPVLIRVETSAGHGAGKSTEKRIQESADLLSFMFYNMKEEIEFDIKG